MIFVCWGWFSYRETERQALGFHAYTHMSAQTRDKVETHGERTHTCALLLHSSEHKITSHPQLALLPSFFRPLHARHKDSYQCLFKLDVHRLMRI